MKKILKELAKGSGPDPDVVEELRVEVHGLKGAALVTGEQRFGRLAERAEQLLAANAVGGALAPELAAPLTEVDAFQAGADAAAAGEPEPPSVAEARSPCPETRGRRGPYLDLSDPARDRLAGSRRGRERSWYAAPTTASPCFATSR